MGLASVSLIGLTACSTPSSITPSKQHFLRPTDPPPGAMMTPLPDDARDVVADTGQQSMADGDVISITVTDMPVRDLLLALARDTKKNLDIHPGIKGAVTISAIDQTLPQILDRIAKQVDLRYEIDNSTILVSPDIPYLKVYQVDYVNMERTTETRNKVSTQVDTKQKDDPTGPGDSLPNQSDITLKTTGTNAFWASLESNLRALLKVTPQTAAAQPITDGVVGAPPLPGAAPMPAAAPSLGGSDEKGKRILAINRESGLITVFAPSVDHARVSEFLHSLMENAHRQVLIESTVVEVELNDDFQQGVDWQSLSNSAARTVNLNAPFMGNSLTNLANLPIFSLPTTVHSGDLGSITATIRALSQFGNTKVLSSPKIMAMNNQTSVLKVVENKVFFTVEASQTSNSDNAEKLINTHLQTVPVGLVMSVTPQISSDNVVTLNVRPTISSISGQVLDPNPHLADSNTENYIPEIQIKEMESLLRVHSGQIAVMGGLMQDKMVKGNTGLPILSRMPGMGSLFGYQNRTVTKSELVIFMRPVVMSHGKPRGPSVANSSASVNTVITPKAANGAPDPAALSIQRAPAMQPRSAELSGSNSQGGSSYLDFTGSGGQSSVVRSSPVPVAPAMQPVQPAAQQHVMPMQQQQPMQQPVPVQPQPMQQPMHQPQAMMPQQPMMQGGYGQPMQQPYAQPAMQQPMGYPMQPMQPQPISMQQGMQPQMMQGGYQQPMQQMQPMPAAAPMPVYNQQQMPMP
uniref:Putative Secretin n=1 Tax=Magnetococcus massalia (strain MO-1) TaxID=451514 RepID=A0A1S7LLW0_MAGMO|nr:putative Secretin [Candidatus Magnetococcus massalia]